MFTAIIENEGNTLVMEFPCKRYLSKVVTASGDRFISKGNRTVVCHNVADHGKITDRDTTLKVVKGKTSVCNCIMQ